MRFSVDMIRLSVKVNRSDLQFLQNSLDTGVVSYYMSNDFKAFRHNFNICETVARVSENPFLSGFERIENSGLVNRVWLGFEHNSKTPNSHHTRLYIEFNPNKTDLNFGVTKQIFNRFFRFGVDSPVIVSCDIAIDLFDVSVNDLVYQKKCKRRILDYIEDGGRTLYFGTKKTSGYTKVYNKAVEQKINDKLWTRVEYSFKLDLDFYAVAGGFFVFDCNIPHLTFYNFENLSLDMDVKDRCCIRSILDGYVTIDMFSRRYKDKLLNIIKQHCTYNLDTDFVYPKAKVCLKDYVNSLFNYS